LDLAVCLRSFGSQILAFSQQRSSETQASMNLGARPNTKLSQKPLRPHEAVQKIRSEDFCCHRQNSKS
jgi:hypothetical protein